MTVRNPALSSVAIATALFMLGCLSWPPLAIHVHDGRAEVDVRSLGEYGTAISRIRLTCHGNSEVIWDVANPDSPQIPGFALQVGENSVLPGRLRDFGFRVSTPATAESFRLATGVEYVIEVWAEGQRKVASQVFRFEDSGAVPSPPP